MKDVYLITASFVGEIKRDFRGYVKMAAKAGYAGLELFNCIYGGFGPQELKNYLASYGMTAISAIWPRPGAVMWYALCCA